MAENRIKKRIELEGARIRVWRALTDHREFGEWFRVALEGPFVPGQTARGHMTYPGYEHIVWEALIEKMEPERLFSFTWAQVCHDKDRYSPDYSNAPRTLVEFRLEKIANGTRCSCSPSRASKTFPPNGARTLSEETRAAGHSR